MLAPLVSLLTATFVFALPSTSPTSDFAVINRDVSSNNPTYLISRKLVERDGVVTYAFFVRAEGTERSEEVKKDAIELDYWRKRDEIEAREGSKVTDGTEVCCFDNIIYY